MVFYYGTEFLIRVRHTALLLLLLLLLRHTFTQINVVLKKALINHFTRPISPTAPSPPESSCFLDRTVLLFRLHVMRGGDRGANLIFDR